MAAGKPSDKKGISLDLAEPLKLDLKEVVEMTGLSQMALIRLCLKAGLAQIRADNFVVLKLRRSVLETADAPGVDVLAPNTPCNGVPLPVRDTIYIDLALGDGPAGIPCVGGIRPEAWGESVQVLRADFPHASYALRVRGESMTGADIQDGDILVFAPRDEHEPQVGDVVAACVDGEVTIKTLAKSNGKVHLRAENPAYPKVDVTEHSAVQGVCLGKRAEDGSKIALSRVSHSITGDVVGSQVIQGNGNTGNHHQSTVYAPSPQQKGTAKAKRGV